MFEDKEVISRSICRNPEGKLVSFCRFGVNQFNGLFIYIQPLQHNTHIQRTELENPAQWISTLYTVINRLLQLVSGCPLTRCVRSRVQIISQGSPAGCNWCVSAWAAAELVWHLLVKEMQDPEESVPSCPNQTPLWPDDENVFKVLSLCIAQLNLWAHTGLNKPWLVLLESQFVFVHPVERKRRV